jgi:hypothetical protein
MIYFNTVHVLLRRMCILWLLDEILCNYLLESFMCMACGQWL